MTEKQVIRELMSIRGWSQQKLAEESGFKSYSNIGGLLNNNSKGIRVDNGVRLVEAMGCELVVRDKMGSKREWVITTQDTEPATEETLEQQLLTGKITFEQAVKQGWKPSAEMLSKMLGGE